MPRFYGQTTAQISIKFGGIWNTCGRTWATLYHYNWHKRVWSCGQKLMTNIVHIISYKSHKLTMTHTNAHKHLIVISFNSDWRIAFKVCILSLTWSTIKSNWSLLSSPFKIILKTKCCIFERSMKGSRSRDWQVWI